MARGQREIWFTTTKSGQRQAWYYSTLAGRAFRMKLEYAETEIAVGNAVESTKPEWVGK